MTQQIGSGWGNGTGGGVTESVSPAPALGAPGAPEDIRETDRTAPRPLASSSTMETSPSRGTASDLDVDDALRRALDALKAEQNPDGYWCAEL
jgi:hypothetical protein